jgi:undecaprenyl-diphosphatase
VLGSLLSHLAAAVSGWVASVPPWVVLLVVFVAGMVEATPFLGILVPAHSAVLAIAYLWGTYARDPVGLALACAVGGALGDILFYALGRRYGLAFMERWPRWARIDSGRRAKLEGLFRAHGMKTILLARSQPVTRSLAPYAAGATRLSALRFLPATTLGSFLVAISIVAGGYLVGRGRDLLGHLIGETLVILVTLVIIALLLSVYLTRHLKVVSRASLRLLLVALGTGFAFERLVRLVVHHGPVYGQEMARWPAALARLPEWSRWLAAPFSLLGDVHVTALAFLLAFALQAARRRWREAYLALATGPGLLGIVLLFRWRIPRSNPLGLPPHFPMTGSFPNESAALATAFLGLLAWWLLRSRSGLRGTAGRTACLVLAALIGAAPLVEGKAWPSDTIAGFALGAAWTALCLLGDTLAGRLLETGASGVQGHGLRGVRWIQTRWDALVRWADKRLWGNDRALWALIGFGALLRVAAPWQWAVGPDADRYSAMALGLLRTGGFLMPWGDVYSPGIAGPSHHFPPLYPFILAGFYGVLGFSRDTLRAASIALALAAMAVTYACTRDLYGRSKGLLATAAVAVSPVLVLTTNKAYSENLLLLLFVLALWAILKSLERPWYIVPGAVFAALGYLTKSSMGYFFLIAGLGGLAWRLHWRGWKVLKDPAYLTAIAVFGAAVVAWGWRNYALFGSWETSSHLTAAYQNAFRHPADWALLLVFSFLFLFALGYLVFLAALPWLPTLAKAPKLASEHDSGLWLAIALPLLLTTLIDSALWLYERDFYFHNVRYVSFVLVPLAWLLMRHARPGKATWAALTLSFAILVAGSAYYALPTVKLENRVSSAWGPLVHDGDSITFVDSNDVYRYFFDLTANGQRNLTVRYVAGPAIANVTTDWALVHGDGTGLPPAYGKVIDQWTGAGTLRSHYTVWRRA